MGLLWSLPGRFAMPLPAGASQLDEAAACINLALGKRTDLPRSQRARLQVALLRTVTECYGAADLPPLTMSPGHTEDSARACESALQASFAAAGGSALAALAGPGDSVRLPLAAWVAVPPSALVALLSHNEAVNGGMDRPTADGVVAAAAALGPRAAAALQLFMCSAEASTGTLGSLTALERAIGITVDKLKQQANVVVPTPAIRVGAPPLSALLLALQPQTTRARADSGEKESIGSKAKALFSRLTTRPTPDHVVQPADRQLGQQAPQPVASALPVASPPKASATDKLKSWFKKF